MILKLFFFGLFPAFVFLGSFRLISFLSGCNVYMQNCKLNGFQIAFFAFILLLLSLSIGDFKYKDYSFLKRFLYILASFPVVMALWILGLTPYFGDFSFPFLVGTMMAILIGSLMSAIISSIILWLINKARSSA